MRRTILIVDDNAINRMLLNNTLCAEFHILEAENGVQALDLMRHHGKELSAVLLDIVMPEMDGFTVLRHMREDSALASIPVIMVTGSEDEGSRVKALYLGANDFILKPFNPEIVIHCIKNNISLRETAAILNAIQKDKLTGLYTREAFFERVTAIIAENEPGYYTMLCFDIDNFKLINERYGTVVGDRILRETGKVVQLVMDKFNGFGGRINSDNFAVLVPTSESKNGAFNELQRGILAAMEKYSVVISAGCCTVTDPFLPASSIYDRAFIAKRSVKGRYDEHMAYFTEKMLQRLVRDQQIIAEMDTAIAEHQFEVWFQPQRDHTTGALVGAEALVRWQHPTDGLIPPGDFIPVFEQNGFVYELDKYVWEEVCRHLRRWMDEGRDPVPVSVNLSRYDVFRPDLIAVLNGLLEKYSVPVSMLRLEITESAFADTTDVIVGIVQQLVAKGFTVEIDDFGSGYSSLNTLKSVPAHVVKLDMRFLEDDSGSGRGGNILESVVRMTKWLGMSVIAEGVEEKAQADYLASVGCSYVQGYLYSRPLPAAEYEEYFHSIEKDSRLFAMEAVAELDNNSFWDPKSMDTLIFNSFVGAACIFEYYDRKMDLLRVNSKFPELLGTISVEDTLKLDWISCLTPDSRSRVREILQKSYENGAEYTDEYKFINIPGTAGATYLRATMRVIARAGVRMLVYCTSENITAQRNAEENERRAIEKSHAAAIRLQLILNNINGAVVAGIFKEHEHRVIFSNDQYYQQLGYTREQFAAEVGSSMLAVAPEDRERVAAEASELSRSGKRGTVVYRILRRDGSTGWVQSNISIITMPGVDSPVQLSVVNELSPQHGEFLAGLTQNK